MSSQVMVNTEMSSLIVTKIFLLVVVITKTSSLVITKTSSLVITKVSHATRKKSYPGIAEMVLPNTKPGQFFFKSISSAAGHTDPWIDAAVHYLANTTCQHPGRAPPLPHTPHCRKNNFLTKRVVWGPEFKSSYWISNGCKA